MSYLLLVVSLAMNPVGYNAFQLPKLWALAFLVFLACIGLWARGEVKLPTSKWVWGLLGGWTLSVVASTVFSDAPWMSLMGDGQRFQGLLAHLLYIAVFLLSFSYFSHQEERDKLYRVTLWGTMIVCGYAILQSLGLDLYLAETVVDFKGRVFSTFGHPNLLGQFLIFLFWLAVYQWWKKKNVKHALMIGVIAWVLILTGNRASWVGVGVGVLLYTTRHFSWKKQLAVWGGGAGVFALLITLTRPALRSFWHRWEVWKATIEILPGAGFFGYGLERFTQAFEGVIPPQMYEYEYVYVVVDRAHQFWLDLWVTQGVFGVLVMAGVVLGITRVAFRRWGTMNDEQWIVLASFFGLITSLQFGFIGVEHGVLLSILLGFLNILFFEKTITVSIGVKRVVILSILPFFILTQVTRMIIGDSVYAFGQLSFQQGDVQGALSKINTATVLNPHQEYLHTQLGGVLYVLGLGVEDEVLNEAAHEAFDIAAEYKGEDFRYYFEKARVYSSQDLDDAAEEYFSLAQQAAENKVVLYEDWARARFDEGDLSGTEQLLKKYFSLLPSVHWRVGELDQLSAQEKDRLRLLLKNTDYFVMRAVWNQVQKNRPVE